MAKINLKRGLTDVVLYLIIFIVVQIIMMYAGTGIWAGIKGESYQATLQAASTGGNAILTALVSVFSSVITLIIFLKTKWTPLTRGYLLSKPWGTLLWVALFSLGTIIPLSFLYEQLGIEMDENTQQIFTSLMKEPWLCSGRHPGASCRRGCIPWSHPPHPAGHHEQEEPLGSHHDFRSHLRSGSLQPGAVYQCPSDGLAPGLDVLSHRESCSGHPAPLGEQHDGVCPIQYHAAERWQAHRPLPWR